MLFRIKASVSTIALVVFFVTTFNALTYAQVRVAERKDPYIWLNAGLGFGTGGLAAGTSISIQYRQLMFSPRVTQIAEILGDSYGDLGLTFGYSSKKPASSNYYALSTGIGFVYGPDNSAIGLPVDLQLFATPFSFIGIGVQCFANLNSQRSFFGIILCLQLGKLR